MSGNPWATGLPPSAVENKPPADGFDFFFLIFFFFNFLFFLDFWYVDVAMYMGKNA